MCARHRSEPMPTWKCTRTQHPNKLISTGNKFQLSNGWACAIMCRFVLCVLWPVKWNQIYTRVCSGFTVHMVGKPVSIFVLLRFQHILQSIRFGLFGIAKLHVSNAADKTIYNFLCSYKNVYTCVGRALKTMQFRCAISLICSKLKTK